MTTKKSEITVIAEKQIPNDNFFTMLFRIHGKPERCILTHNQLYTEDKGVINPNLRFMMFLNQGHFKENGEEVKFTIKHGKNTVRTGILIAHNKTRCGKISFRLILVKNEFGEKWIYCVPDCNFEEIKEEVAA